MSSLLAPRSQQHAGAYDKQNSDPQYDQFGIVNHRASNPSYRVTSQPASEIQLPAGSQSGLHNAPLTETSSPEDREFAAVAFIIGFVSLICITLGSLYLLLVT